MRISSAKDLVLALLPTNETRRIRRYGGTNGRKSNRKGLFICGNYCI
jgi:hypothetical protein